MKKFLILFLLFANHAFAFENWNSEDGLKRLNQSQFKRDFYQLLNFYQPQINPLYCSAASSVIILNALNYGDIASQKSGEVTKPSNDVIPFQLYTQSGFFNDKTDKIKTKAIIDYKEKNADGIYDAGVSLADLNKILRKAYNLKTKLTYAENASAKSIENFRKILQEVLSEDKKFILANFNGKDLGQPTGGHISPIAAYDQETDSLLILDVALHKNPWFWVDLTEFYKAMNTKDGAQYRGFLVVSKQ